MIPVRRLASGFGLRVVDVVFQALAALWVSPLLIHALGLERYGLWVTLLTVVGYVDILDFGLTSAVTRYVSRARGKGDATEVLGVISTAFAILVWIGAGSLLVVGALAAIVPHFLAGSAELGPVRELILVLGVTAALCFPMRVFTGVLEAHVRYELTTLASIVRTLISTVLLYFVATRGGSLTAVVTVVCGTTLLQRAMSYAFARSVVPEMRLLPLRLSGEAKGVLLRYGWKNFLIKLIDVVRFRVDHLVIARCIGVGWVGLYAPGMSLIRYYREAMDCLGGVFMPVFSAADGAGDREGLRRYLAVSLKTSSALATYIGGSLMLYGGWFVDRWLGPGFHESYLVMLTLAPAVLGAMAQLPGVYLFFALSRQEKLVRLHACEGVLNLALSLILVGKLGIYGVALGTGIALFLSKCVVQPWMVCSLSGLGPRSYYLDSILAPMAKMALPMLLVWWAVFDWMSADYTRLIVAQAIQAAAVAPVAWWMLFTGREREQLLSIVRRKKTQA